MDREVLLRFFTNSYAICLLPRYGRYEHEANCDHGHLYDCYFLNLPLESLIRYFVALHEKIQVG
jgi:hypothetical protein